MNFFSSPFHELCMIDSPLLYRLENLDVVVSLFEFLFQNPLHSKSLEISLALLYSIRKFWKEYVFLEEKMNQIVQLTFTLIYQTTSIIQNTFLEIIQIYFLDYFNDIQAISEFLEFNTLFDDSMKILILWSESKFYKPFFSSDSCFHFAQDLIRLFHSIPISELNFTRLNLIARSLHYFLYKHYNLYHMEEVLLIIQHICSAIHPANGDLASLLSIFSFWVINSFPFIEDLFNHLQLFLSISAFPFDPNISVELLLLFYHLFQRVPETLSVISLDFVQRFLVSAVLINEDILDDFLNLPCTLR